MRTLRQLLEIYGGSDGDATKELYDALEDMGPEGHIATNLFRAHKASARAKSYRGRFKGMAYDRKEWALQNLITALDSNAEGIGLKWGWGNDLAQEFHKWVIYIDLPSGQVSYHTQRRGFGPTYLGIWDGVKHAGAVRICIWIESLLTGKPVLSHYRPTGYRDQRSGPEIQKCFL
jgi:hypothetical protein